jgi:hypothetical protein
MVSTCCLSLTIPNALHPSLSDLVHLTNLIISQRCLSVQAPSTMQLPLNLIDHGQEGPEIHSKTWRHPSAQGAGTAAQAVMKVSSIDNRRHLVETLLLMSSLTFQDRWLARPQLVELAIQRRSADAHFKEPSPG